MERDEERIDDLLWRGLKIIQKPGWFCFSLDAVLLADFTTVKESDRVVDLGAGTGVIPLLLAARCRKIKITGLEIKAQVVDMARRSIGLNGLNRQIAIQEGDIKEASLLLGRGKYDLVVSNPPYTKVNTGKSCASSIKAAARIELLCTLEDVVREASSLLNSGGRLALVHRPRRLADIFYLMRSCRLEPKRMRLVCPLPGKEPNLVLVEGIKNGKRDLVIYPPLFVYQEPGLYSGEMQEIFAGRVLPGEW